ncbi:MAG: hypothetical protein ACHP8B_02505 [Terriglobales bacterium]
MSQVIGGRRSGFGIVSAMACYQHFGVRAAILYNAVVSRPNRIGLLFSLAPLALTAVLAQSLPDQAPKQQTDFDMEEPLERPVVLPSAALDALKTSNLSAQMLRSCAEDAEITIDQIPASWFVGSWIQLSGDPSSGLVVRAQNGCFWGAHITQFWLLSRIGANYRVVFTGRADSFRVLSTGTNGFRDVQLVFIMKAGAEGHLVTFKYADGEYKESNTKIERDGDEDDE